MYLLDKLTVSGHQFMNFSVSFTPSEYMHDTNFIILLTMHLNIFIY